LSEITVLLSLYGENSYAKELLASLKSQTHPVRLISRSDDEPEHLGIVNSYRRLLGQVPSDSSYIMFCDQDDVWFPHKAETLLRAMEREEATFEGPVLVHGDAVVTDSGLNVVKRRFIAKWARKRDFFSILMFNMVQGASMLINRPLYELIKELPYDSIFYDRFIHMAAEIAGRRVFVDEPLMYYRQHAGNSIGAFSMSKKRMGHFFSTDEEILYSGNERICRDYHGYLSEDKKRALVDYEEMANTRNPFKRSCLILRYLWRFPGTSLKKLPRAWLCRPR
jgi:rhamnosyltransferase